LSLSSSPEETTVRSMTMLSASPFLLRS
jgi:hypothetical protein